MARISPSISRSMRASSTTPDRATFSATGVPSSATARHTSPIVPVPTRRSRVKPARVAMTSLYCAPAPRDQSSAPSRGSVPAATSSASGTPPPSGSGSVGSVR